MNLAVEEILLKNTKNEFFILGVNDVAVIIGKHQSGHIELNTKFISENHIPVIRRISGGGTVFHDRGNINFSFISNSESGKQVDFMKYTLPVIDFLKSMGVEARFEGKNDLKVSGLKVSGNAEHIHGNRVLHHGTLLFSTSLEMLRNSIREDSSCYTSRAVISNPSSVLNLNEKINSCQDINEFRSEMMNYFLKNFHENFPYTLTQTETKQAQSLADSKYKTWEWNWAYGPEYRFVKQFAFEGRQILCRLFVKEGTIRECQLDGIDKLKGISKKFIGCRHMVNDLKEVFRSENIFLNEEEVFNFF
jgi:lipoate-protein ligase A